MSPKSPDQFKAQREDRKQEILEAALSLFAQNGFENTRIQQITEKASISKGLFYNYFESKEAILQELFALLFTKIQELVKLVESYKSGITNPQETIKTLLSLTHKSAVENLEFWTFYSRLTFQLNEPEDTLAKLLQFEKAYNAQLACIFSDLGYANAKTEAILFNNTLDGIILNYVLRPKNYPLDAVMNQFKDKYSPKI